MNERLVLVTAQDVNIYGNLLSWALTLASLVSQGQHKTAHNKICWLSWGTGSLFQEEDIESQFSFEHHKLSAF